MEPEAKDQFVRKNKNRHADFKADGAGLFLDVDNQFLGASPDMLVSCRCCGEGVVEIKCPLVSPCDKCNPNLCSCKLLPYFNYANGRLSLKVNHTYYGQIQGQMAITGRNYCDFFVYSSHATHQERIYFNEDYWKVMVDNLVFFYNKFMVPYLISSVPSLDTNKEPEEMEMDDTFVNGDVYFCPLCNERIKEQENINNFGDRSICCDACNKWCHFKCVKMTSSVLKSLKIWKCPSCNLR